MNLSKEYRFFTNVANLGLKVCVVRIELLIDAIKYQAYVE